MPKLKKAVIVVHREESEDDFHEIARRVRKLDPSIGIATVSEFLTSKMVPAELLQLPLLVIYLCNPPKTEFKVATKLAVKEMSKLEEYDHFKQHNIPCLPIERFTWGMGLDPAIYGDWVVLKPENIQSTGKDVNLVPTELIQNLHPLNFPEDHLIHQDGYFVQKFLKTGKAPVHYRVMIFLDEILYSRVSVSNIPYPETVDLKTLLTTSVASNTSDRLVDFFKDNKINQFALRVAKTFDQAPLFGLDILHDEISGNLFVLEANLGGNVWHFSSLHGREKRGVNHALRKAMILQYYAWDRAAEALVRKTHELAR